MYLRLLPNTIFNLYMVESCKDLLLSSLTQFYNNYPNNKTLLKDIIEGNHLLSLRLIDWFVTHYSKSHNISYWVDTNGYYTEMPLNNNITKRISLYLDYRDQLKSYTKINFDSFRRHARITYFIDFDNNQYIDTTIGQLNFFRWIFKNKVIEYITHNYDDVYKDMIENNTKTIIKRDKKKNNSQEITRTFCTLRFD